jgi:2-oxoglutarate ferredoxin oxidoreductase subunit beta
MPTLDQRIHEQIAAARQKLGEGDLEKLLNSGDTWVVK